ncbi:MAG: hypothetical protein IT291_06815 [Deltaproteobacteria bacterium]|nr:hypothetical protein [Deltaproteobacteria bacterium]
MVNASALAYWSGSRYSRDAVDRVCKEIDDKRLALRLECKADGTLSIRLSTRAATIGQGHFPTVIRFFQDVVQSWTGKPLIGTAIIWLEDGLHKWHAQYRRRTPILAFGRRRIDNQTFLIPDPAFMQDCGYREEFAQIRDIEREIPWHAKQKTVFWRGAASGHACESENFQNAPRIALGILSDKVGDPSRLDAYISSVPDYAEKHKSERILALGLLKPHTPFLEFVKYRYQVDVDGYSCAWKSLFLKLAMQSVVLKVQGEHMQWYYEELKPWVHYIPVEADLLDFLDILDWLPSHDEQCRQISANANKLVSSITYNKARQEVGQLLADVFSCQDM